ncbi:ATP synthase F0 subcomplex B subunit [Arcticibacter pallidicorallinus]|uniref:ATP synthase subunit b n=1 Tax=Arcticibacter pallidicorallinus TaxID=1259464 RepID=A0A2T0U6M6_9SPHI|nr:F0F1 ATP synthase subunit B [Arcticibacter pallidicorallinus]PRY53554.1 ATP synthase F0 subcomplex B subunit [Arcticibacter pallidicorallinus]
MGELFEGILNHHLGFVVWASVAFLLLLIILKKLAWQPILGMISERERFIENALASAEKAKEEMARLTNENESLLKEARAERDLILKEAKELKDKIVAEARTSAQTEGAKMIEKAKQEIDSQKVAALNEVKDQVATLSIEIAEKILRNQFEDRNKQQALVSDLLKEVKLN